MRNQEPQSPPAVTTLHKVYCRHDAIVDPVDLKPHPKNPNNHPPEQLELFALVVTENGWRRPVTVSRRSGCITKGHGQREAAIKFNLGGVPVEYQDYDSEKAELADIVADNRLGELAKRNNKKLADLLVEMDDGAFNMVATGYDEEALGEFLSRVGVMPELEMGDVKDAPPSPELVEAPVSHVRMVQLFLNDETLPEFNKIVDKLQLSTGCDNLTDAVMAGLRMACAST